LGNPNERRKSKPHLKPEMHWITKLNCPRKNGPSLNFDSSASSLSRAATDDGTYSLSDAACQVVNESKLQSFQSKAIRTLRTLNPSFKRNIMFWSSRFSHLYHSLPHSSILYILLYIKSGPTR
jgi:hypothetical protein